jgi:hypothetical protein
MKQRGAGEAHNFTLFNLGVHTSAARDFITE